MNKHFLIVPWPVRSVEKIRAVIGLILHQNGMRIWTQYEDECLEVEGSIEEARKLPELQRPHFRVYDLEEPERIFDLISDRPDLEYAVALLRSQQEKIDNPPPPMSEEEALVLQAAIHGGDPVGP